MDPLLSLIGQMYDAALDPSLWPGVLEQMCAYLHVARLSLVLEDALSPTKSAFVHASFTDPTWVTHYMERYLLINPMRLAMVTRVAAGDVVLTSDFMTPEEYGRTLFSRGFLAPRDLVDIAVVVLEKTATCITVLSAKRNSEQGFADEDLRQKLETIAPHVQRAAAIGRLLEQKTLQADTFAATLDTLNAAVLLVDASGAIVHANAQADAMLAAADVVEAIQQRLVLVDRCASDTLLKALAGAAKGDGALGTAGRAIPAHARDGRKYVVTLMPLTAGRRRTIGHPFHAVAALCIKEAEFEVSSSVETLGPLHALTRREMAVLVASVEQGGVPDVAAVLGLAEPTVKSHLKSIYRKTGATRQSDLVKLVAGVAGPFK